MTTKLIQSNKPFGAQVPGFNQFPALFNDNWFNSFFKDVDKAFEAPGVHYPYDILVCKDPETSTTFEYEIHVALAGLSKEDIKIQVKENKLIININPTEDSNNNVSKDYFVEYLRNGISYRKASLEFSLAKDVDSQNICSKFKDGLLKVYIPLTEKTSTDITIDVD
jgi:HSP20 family molecular chaperone IbpA